MKFAILFGGMSYEHEISIVSAIALKKVLKTEPKFIFCSSEREFFLIEPKNMKAKHFSSGSFRKDPKLSLTNGGFFLSKIFGKQKIDFDAIVNLIHGSDGEDGKIASLLEFFGVEFIGANLEASAISYSKLWTKYLAQEVGVKTLSYKQITRESPNFDFKLPVILKPTHLGSSIGLSVVKENSQLEYAKDVAFEFDKSILVEPFIEGVKEYNLAGCLTKDGFCFGVIEEPQKKELLDFDQKYLDFSRSSKVKDANISEDLRKKMREAFKKIYLPYFKGALIRCDFFVIDGEVYINEINPHPGSLANYLFEDFENVLEKLAQNLPKRQKIKVDYSYIHSIHSAKGKL